MSLLMEALKKAEEAKRLAGESSAPGTASELTLKPITASAPRSTTPPPVSPLPDLSLHIDSVDADLAAVSTEAPARRRTPPSFSRPSDAALREEAERTAARNVFAAKQAPNARTGLWLFLGLAGLAALGLGGYFWWQLQAVSSGSLSRPIQPLPSTSRPLPAPASSQRSATSAAEAAPPLPEASSPPAASAPRTTPEPARPFERAVRPQKPSTSAAQAAPDAPVRLSRSQPKSNPTLERAYDALQAGQLDDAQRDYEQVLRSDAKSTDALLGLATIAASRGQSERAQAYYQYALESDPNDATAQAGLINTKGQGNPGLSESRLKTALASQPDSSALHFALGNLYARQARWSEAQQAYFRAYASEPDNADFLFNLAVSLDHLRQNKLAAQYYRMALKAAGEPGSSHNASFDRNQAQSRILELQP
jgi:Tfp pilus assembly protein PilF